MTVSAGRTTSKPRRRAPADAAPSQKPGSCAGADRRTTGPDEFPGERTPLASPARAAAAARAFSAGNGFLPGLIVDRTA